MLILVFNEESTTEQVNNQIFVFMFVFSPWASMAAAVLNVLKMDQNVETNNKSVQVVYLIPQNQIQSGYMATTRENLLA